MKNYKLPVSALRSSCYSQYAIGSKLAHASQQDMELIERQEWKPAWRSQSPPVSRSEYAIDEGSP